MESVPELPDLAQRMFRLPASRLLKVSGGDCGELPELRTAIAGAVLAGQLLWKRREVMA